MLSSKFAKNNYTLGMSKCQSMDCEYFFINCKLKSEPIYWESLNGIIFIVENINTVQEFRPISTSRRSEIGSWFMVAASGFAWWILSQQGSSLAIFMILFLLLFLFLAAGTSLANWMERRTILRIQADELNFSNGLRDVSLAWNKIQQVHVMPSRWGRSVHVFGEFKHFHFKMAGNVNVLGQTSARVGFENGVEILQTIIERSGLQPVKRDQPGKFYARS